MRARAIAFQPLAHARVAAWLAFALTLAVAPLLFRSSLALTVLTQIGYTTIICLSYNLLLGEGGMLSFGHAVYSGLGAFCAIHALNLIGAGTLLLPVSLVPLAGGLGGAAVALMLGWVSTKKSANTFAMITLGMGELVFAMSPMFPGFFGGEGGISANRVVGRPFFGISFGPQIQVYYLIAFYCFVCTAALFAFTRTPLGRMLNAVRDNPERVEFVGYDTQMVRYLAFVIAGFFAGIGGGLTALNFEIVTAESMSTARSGTYLLFTFLGGAMFFHGPVIGAVLLVLATVLLSELTQAWLLYLGLAFMLMVMFAPGGIASLIAVNLRVWTSGLWPRLVKVYAGMAVSGAVLIAGVATLVEMTYQLQLEGSSDAGIKIFGQVLGVHSAPNWLAALAMALIGAIAFGFARRRFKAAWDAVQEEIELRRRSVA